MRNAAREYCWQGRVLERRFFAFAFGPSVKGDCSTNDCYCEKPTRHAGNNHRRAGEKGQCSGPRFVQLQSTHVDGLVNKIGGDSLDFLGW